MMYVADKQARFYVIT